MYSLNEISWCSNKTYRRELLDDISSLHKSGDYSKSKPIRENINRINTHKIK